jgi:hypothetical protein
MLKCKANKRSINFDFSNFEIYIHDVEHSNDNQIIMDYCLYRLGNKTLGDLAKSNNCIDFEKIFSSLILPRNCVNYNSKAGFFILFYLLFYLLFKLKVKVNKITPFESNSGLKLKF